MKLYFKAKTYFYSKSNFLLNTNINVDKILFKISAESSDIGLYCTVYIQFYYYPDIFYFSNIFLLRS